MQRNYSQSIQFMLQTTNNAFDIENYHENGLQSDVCESITVLQNVRRFKYARLLETIQYLFSDLQKLTIITTSMICYRDDLRARSPMAWHLDRRVNSAADS